MCFDSSKVTSTHHHVVAIKVELHKMFSYRSIHASEYGDTTWESIHQCQIWLIYHSLLSTPPKKKDCTKCIRLAITNITFINPNTPSHYCFFCHLHNVRLCRVLWPSSSSISRRDAIHITTRNIADGFLIHQVSVSRCISYHITTN